MKLLQKLCHLNFADAAVLTIEFLKNRTHKVMLQTASSDWIELYQGVLQRTILGSLLFNLLVKSLQNNSENRPAS